MASFPSPIAPKTLALSSPSLLPFLRARNRLLPRLHSHTLDSHLSLTNPPVQCQENKKRRKRKLRPNFYEQTIQRWSAKVPSQRTRYPWQEEQREGEEEAEEEDKEESLGPNSNAGRVLSSKGESFRQSRLQMGAERENFRLGLIVEKMTSSLDANGSEDSEIRLSDTVNEKPLIDESSGFPVGREVLAPWIHEEEETEEETEAHLDSVPESESSITARDSAVAVEVELEEDATGPMLEKHELTLDQSSFGSTVGTLFSNLEDEDSLGFDEISNEISLLSSVSQNENKASSLVINLNGKSAQVTAGLIVDKLKSSLDHHPNSDLDNGTYSLKSNDGEEPNSNSDIIKLIGSVAFPWERSTDDSGSEPFRRRSKTDLAESTIPEQELRRLRNVSLRMKERMKVGAAGVTEALVASIHEKWKEAEVVKLKFEDAPSMNMKRTHEILERRTGGLVIWRSGSSVVLYRGMTYELPCVQTYSRLANVGTDQENAPFSDVSASNKPGDRVKDALTASTASDMDNMSSLPESSEDSTGIFEIDSLLDQLGPRFRDWSGPDPLPVDADLLPGVVLGYKPPYRLLPYKTKRSLQDREVTFYRRLARGMPPHFALGRNRQHQGLANAMVKLWEISAVAKIAIKRGVSNTCNDQMAEELKKLTGGVLLSRNREYIVFYRGNDFLPPSVRSALVEKLKLATVKQDEEEQARLRASALIASSDKTVKGPLVAGTLEEFEKANTHWSNQPSHEDREKMRRDLALAKHAASVRYLERKLGFALLKVRKAEKALSKVQEFLKPAEIPTDLETLTDEERFLFRKMGLKMKPFLLVGRRDVFDGTIQNMHLHWKHRELVKLIVRGKSFPQVKHIAITLEAESGGVLVSLDKTTKGYAIVLYRGKNYQQPYMLKPQNLLTKREALARAIELQRREALFHYIAALRERIHLLKSQLAAKKLGHEINLKVNRDFPSDDVEDEGEEAYLKTYDSGDEEDETSTE